MAIKRVVRKKYPHAVIATDVVILTVHEEQLRVLLIKMKKKPYIGMWAVPGGLVQGSESVDAAAKRHLIEKTGVKDIFLEQLYTFGRVNRDPFGRVVSVAYFSLIPNANLQLKTTKDYEDVAWFSVKKLPKLAYDHDEIIHNAINRLKAKLGYSTISYSLLPKEFTLSQLQHIYEVILSTSLDKRNFRKKILSLGLVKKIGKKRIEGASRPAELYMFLKRFPSIADVL
ncbi:MAG: NUDIX domain-containing protein [bacterium]|nr:NUDIX domain-containing protein [bacterium]